MKILICDALAKNAIDGLKSLGVDVIEKTSIEKEELMGEITDYDGIIVRGRTKVRKDLIDKAAGSLGFIIRAGVGLDNIDFEYAREKGIEVINTPEATTNSVAELAIAHIFSLLRDIPRGTSTLKKGEWIKKQLVGSELTGKTVGIIGMGRIGRRVAELVIPFDGSVLGYDPYVKEVDNDNIKMTNLDELLTNSDIITLHLPHTDETHYLIGEEELRKMKDTAFLIDCARGGIVDEEALCRVLKDGAIAGAGFDVFEKEPPEGSKLMELDNFNCTPHIGAQAKEGKVRLGEEVVKKVAARL